MEKLIFKPRATLTHDLNYLSKVDSTIVNEVHSAIDYLCERGRLAKEFDDHKLHGIYEGYSEFHIRDTAMKNVCKCIQCLIFKYIMIFPALHFSYQRLHQYSDIPIWE